MLGIATLLTLALSTSLGHDNGVHAAVWRVPLERHVGAVSDTALQVRRELLDGRKKTASVWEPGSVPVEFPSSAREGLATTLRHPVPVDFRDISVNMFAAKLALGTPPQLVSLVLDVSGADLMVLNHKLGAHTYYDHATSSTYEANGTHVTLFDGQPFAIDGFVSRDVVTLGGADGGSRLTVHDQLFVELESPDTILGNFPPKLDGFIAFGPGRANTTGAPSLARAMVEQQLLDRPEVGLGFGDGVAHAMFGGIDPAYQYKDVHYYTQQHTLAWMAPVSGIAVDGKRVLGDVGFAGIANADLILGPSDQVDAIADAVGAENYALPCDGPGPDITFELGDGFHITLTKEDYAIPKGEGWCMFAFMPLPIPQWILGLPVLQKVYTVLDFGTSERSERLGFAHVKP